MNFEIICTGHSFKGAMAYYLHDKRQEGQDAHPTTSDRVAFTETRNMMEVGPHTATRIMIGTAAQADELKRAAGVKATGRKATAGPVYAFSLQWKPDELGSFDRAEMVARADEALKILGLSDRQAVIVAHRDTAHPHVHIVVNRVSPVDGRMATVGKDAVRKLDRWAYEYERDRGVIVSPNRDAKHQEIDRKRKQHPDQEKRRQYVAEQQAAKKAQQQFTRAAEATAGRLDAAKVKQTAATRGKSEGAILKELHDAQKVRHKQEWADLSKRNKAAREQVYSDFGAIIRQQADEHKARTKPAWAEFFRAARMNERAFFARERSIVGILQNALAATPLGQRGSLSAVFRNVLSASNREAAFRAAQAHERAGMQGKVKAALDAQIAAVKQQRAVALAEQRKTYDATRAALIERQDGEKAKMREAWRQVYERRGKDPRFQARQKAAPQQEQKPMRDTFDKARELAPAKLTPSPARETARITSPAPAPSPAGDVPAPNRTAQPVPRVDRAAEWAKSEQGKAAMAKDAPPPPAKAQFTKQAEPEQAKPSFADRFRQKAAERPAVDRQRERDREFDRD
ncbi:hypothetical protein MBRA_06463 [Methylobacterium brachiatum]|jgi:hypothetical protein|nr:hypothetical protein MBRA_06463 [Methylobacterium brachiatum]